MLAKLGGQEVLQKATDQFYDRQLQDSRLMKFFRGTDMAILKWHQFNLMSIAFTHVPEEFDVNHLITVRHKKLFDDGLTELDFDLVLGHFKSTVEELKQQGVLLDESVVEESLSVVRPLRKVFEEGARMARDRRAVEQRRLWTARTVTVAALVVLVVSRAVRRVKK